MDRNTIIGFLLIGLVLMVWMYFNAPPPPPPGQTGKDTLITQGQKRAEKTPPLPVETKGGEPADTLGKFFSADGQGVERRFAVETDDYRVELSTRGGSIVSWVEKRFKTWDGYPVDLIPQGGSDFHLLFTTADGKLISTKGLYFEGGGRNGEVVRLSPHDSATIDFILPVTGGGRIVKSLTFYGALTSFDAAYRFEDLQNVIANYEYQVTWDGGMRYVEHNTINESNFAKASVFAGGELTEVDATKLGETVKQNISGRVAWVAQRNKYFATAIIPREKESQGAYLEGWREPLPDQGAREVYNMALRMPFTAKALETDRFTVYVGPLDFDGVKKYGVELERIMSLGAAWIIRPISEYVIIPLFKLIHYVIPNYGFVLIVFSLIIKIVLHPLTRTSMRSMQKMQALQPMMTEIREKYKDDPQKMNQSVMRLYKEYGVNPAGGCLPMLLQLPILYALWAVFSSTIELRQASFMFWIHDLSVPDVITDLPFRIPLFGINQLSGLALLMGVTMLVQQKMSVKDPRQQAMVYMMPILMTLMFNGFPAGLNLYYFVFNLLSIGQQAWINKQHKGEPLRKVEPGKSGGGFIAKLAANLPKQPPRKH